MDDLEQAVTTNPGI